MTATDPVSQVDIGASPPWDAGNRTQLGEGIRDRLLDTKLAHMHMTL